MNHVYDEEGFIILEEEKDAIVADVLRMKAGSSAFSKQFGEDAQHKAVNLIGAYSSARAATKTKSKLLDTLGGIASIAIPVLAKNLLGLNVSVSKDFGLNLDVFFK